MKNKKILIPIIILIAVVVLFATFVIFGGKDKPILIADDNDVNVEEIQEELEEELEDQLEVAKLALTLLEDGKVNLYSIDTDEMISQLDLALTHSETIKENTESVGMLVTDKESLVGQSEVFITSEESDPVSEEVETTSKDIYKNIKNGSDEFLIFYNENSDRLFSIKTTNGVITRELLLNGIDVKNLNTVWADNDVIYLTMKDKSELIKYDLKSEEKSKEVFSLEGTPTALTVKGGLVYYTFSDKLAKLDTVSKQTNSVLLGDRSNDVVFVKDNLYVVNDFGSGKNNSILMKINPNDLKVDGIIELKGANSKLIGVNNSKTVLFVAQNEEDYNVKSVDLTKFKPLYSYSLIEDTDFKSYDDALYYQEGNALKVHSLRTNEVIKEISIEGTLINVK